MHTCPIKVKGLFMVQHGCYLFLDYWLEKAINSAVLSPSFQHYLILHTTTNMYTQI